jgi:hypothetical protein
MDKFARGISFDFDAADHLQPAIAAAAKAYANPSAESSNFASPLTPLPGSSPPPNLNVENLAERIEAVARGRLLRSSCSPSCAPTISGEDWDIAARFGLKRSAPSPTPSASSTGSTSSRRSLHKKTPSKKLRARPAHNNGQGRTNGKGVNAKKKVRNCTVSLRALAHSPQETYRRNGAGRNRDSLYSRRREHRTAEKASGGDAWSHFPAARNWLRDILFKTVEVRLDSTMYRAEKGGYRAAKQNMKYSPETAYTPEVLDSMGFRCIDWDGRCAIFLFFFSSVLTRIDRSAIVITDRNSRIVAVAAGPPADGGGEGSGQSTQSFIDACGDFAQLLLPYGAAKSYKKGQAKRGGGDGDGDEKDGRRGNFAAVNFGIKLGPGHKARMVIRSVLQAH